MMMKQKVNCTDNGSHGQRSGLVMDYQLSDNHLTASLNAVLRG